MKTFEGYLKEALAASVDPYGMSKDVVITNAVVRLIQRSAMFDVRGIVNGVEHAFNIRLIPQQVAEIEQAIGMGE